MFVISVLHFVAAVSIAVVDAISVINVANIFSVISFALIGKSLLSFSYNLPFFFSNSANL